MGLNRRLDSNLVPTLAAITDNTIFAAVDGPISPRKFYQVPVSVPDARWLRISQNLADLNNAGVARTNLGLGSAAVANVGDFATAAQGALAASALQPAAIGVSLQAYNGNLADIAALAPGAPEDGYAIAWDNGAGAFVLASLASLLPVEETTPIVYQAGDVTRTATFDLSALTAARSYALPNIGTTLAGLSVAQTFTAAQKIDVNSTIALLVEQNGVKNNVWVVDTANGRVGVNTVPAETFHVSGDMLVDNNHGLFGLSTTGNARNLFRYNNFNEISYGDFNEVSKILFKAAGSKYMYFSTGRLGIMESAPTASLDVIQNVNNATIPVVKFTQADISEEIIWFEGESDAGSADRSLVSAGDFTTPGALLGWFKVKLEDNRVGGIGIVDGWIEVKAIPTA